jgi:hypothetical protein
MPKKKYLMRIDRNIIVRYAYFYAYLVFLVFMLGSAVSKFQRYSPYEAVLPWFTPLDFLLSVINIIFILVGFLLMNLRLTTIELEIKEIINGKQ